MHWLYCLLLLLNLGGILLLTRQLRPKLNQFFVPALGISAIMLATWAGGMIGQMQVSNILLYMAGFAGYVMAGWHYFKNRKMSRLWPIIGFTGCLVAGMLSSCFFQGRILYAYDDFTHWGKVIQLMVREGRFPVVEDRLQFTSYPLGSACFVTYCASILGAGNDQFLFAQFLMVCACAAPLFSAVPLRKDKKQSALLQGMCAVLFLLLIQYNNSLETLYVDNLLALSFSAAVLLYLLNSDHPAYGEITVLLSCVVLIKNSGFFLSVLFAALLILHETRHGQDRLRAAFTIAVPLLIFLLWRLHVIDSFEDVSKHDLSVANYAKVFAENRLYISEILSITLPCILSPLKNHAIPLLLMMTVFYFLGGKKDRCRTVLLLSCVLTVAYEIGVLAMYLFSMPYSEVVSQQGSDYLRYNGTLVAIMVMIMAWTAFAELNYEELLLNKAHFIPCLSLICCGVLLSANLQWTMTARDRRNTEPEVNQMFCISKEQQFSKDAFFVVRHSGEKKDYYINIMSRYYLDTRRVKVYHDPVAAKEEFLDNQRDYLINLTDGKVEQRSAD